MKLTEGVRGQIFFCRIIPYSFSANHDGGCIIKIMTNKRLPFTYSIFACITTGIDLLHDAPCINIRLPRRERQLLTQPVQEEQPAVNIPAPAAKKGPACDTAYH